MQTKFSKCQIQKKKLKRGPSLKENSGLNRVPGYATFGIVKVDYPGPWVFYLALSIIALPQKLKAFFKGNRQTQALQPGAATPLFMGGHFWGFAGLLTTHFPVWEGYQFVNFTATYQYYHPPPLESTRLQSNTRHKSLEFLVLASRGMLVTL